MDASVIAAIGAGGIDATMGTGVNWTYDATAGTLAKASGLAFTATIAQTGYPNRPYLIPGVDALGFFDAAGQFRWFNVMKIVSANTLNVQGTGPSFGPAVIPDEAKTGGMFRFSRTNFSNSQQRAFGAPFAQGAVLTGNTPLVGYSIVDPVFNLCSIQLSDAVQRHLNEFSAVNGLEIVYADWDRTCAPISGSTVAIHTEVRKSASRALQVFATVISATPGVQYTRNSFASVKGGIWNNYQWQLGSLYFPHQKATDNNSDPAIHEDNMLGQCYAYTADAFDRFHPKAAPTMMTLHGDGVDWRRIAIIGVETYTEYNPDTYLVPNSLRGKRGSFSNGAWVVGTTLERSTMFDLSGVPINNSRVLALNGEFNFGGSDTDGTLMVFLKYVRLARVFLINIEVEQ